MLYNYIHTLKDWIGMDWIGPFYPQLAAKKQKWLAQLSAFGAWKAVLAFHMSGSKLTSPRTNIIKITTTKRLDINAGSSPAASKTYCSCHIIKIMAMSPTQTQDVFTKFRLDGSAK
jgi:hypothetical protein